MTYIPEPDTIRYIQREMSMEHDAKQWMAMYVQYTRNIELSCVHTSSVVSKTLPKSVRSFLNLHHHISHVLILP